MYLKNKLVLHLPPWRIPSVDVTFTPITKDTHPILQKQVALETVASVSPSIFAIPSSFHRFPLSLFALFPIRLVFDINIFILFVWQLISSLLF